MYVGVLRPFHMILFESTTILKRQLTLWLIWCSLSKQILVRKMQTIPQLLWAPCSTVEELLSHAAIISLLLTSLCLHHHPLIVLLLSCSSQSALTYLHMPLCSLISWIGRHIWHLMIKLLWYNWTIISFLIWWSLPLRTDLLLYFAI